MDMLSRNLMPGMVVLGLLAVLATGCITTGKTQVENAVKQDATSAGAAETLVIRLERTACFGKCPVYSLTINGDGKVIYEGKEFVKITGTRETTITPETVSKILNKFDKADYFSLKDSYTGFGKSDMPHANTSISMGDRTKSVRHYLGDQNAPGKLIELENAIDELVNSAQWIK